MNSANAATSAPVAPPRAAGKSPPAVAVLVGFTTFPGEIFAARRSWVEIMYSGLAYFSEVERGGHFALIAECDRIPFIRSILVE